MLFMVIERFQDNDMVPIYKQVRDGGRMIPEGLTYIDSWVEPNFSRCFQLMACDDLRLFQEWVLQWRGFGATLEIIPVVSSKETREVIAPYLDRMWNRTFVRIAPIRYNHCQPTHVLEQTQGGDKWMATPCWTCSTIMNGPMRAF